MKRTGGRLPRRGLHLWTFRIVLVVWLAAVGSAERRSSDQPFAGGGVGCLGAGRGGRRLPEQCAAHVGRPQSSPFVSVAADVSFIRLSETGSEFTMFLLIDDKQYFDVPSVNGERFASGTAQLARPLGPRDKVGIEFNVLVSEPGHGRLGNGNQPDAHTGGGAQRLAEAQVDPHVRAGLGGAVGGLSAARSFMRGKWTAIGKRAAS